MEMNSSVFNFLVGWILIIVILVVIAKTELGNRLIYYVLWLAALILVLTNASFFQKVWSNGASTISSSSVGTGTKGS